jgi:hypothetical protein
VSSPVDQVVGWLGAIWSAVWAEGSACIDPNGNCGGAVQGGCTIDPDGNCGAAQGGIWIDPNGGPSTQGGICIDPNGRPAPCPS